MRCWHERETYFHYYCTNKYIDAICLRTKNGSATVATATDSTITKDNFEKQLKDRYGKDMLYEMMAQDVITKNIKYLMKR